MDRPADRALAFLAGDPLLHMGMISPIQRGTAEVLFAGEDGVLLRESVSGAYMLSAASPEAGARLMELIPQGAALFAVHQGYMAEAVEKRYHPATRLDNLQAVYTKKTPLSIPKDVDIRPLDEGFAEAVHGYYHVDVGLDYIRRRMAAGDMYGCFVNGCLAGFIGFHEEGSLGLLEMLEPYRNRGLGGALLGFMVNVALGRGFVPFSQVRAGNEGSLRLHRRLGFEISQDMMYWLF